jgi:competence protein ComEA
VPRSVAPPPPAEDAPPAPPTLNLNASTYEQLRALGLSVTETGRILAHRETTGGFRSLDELDSIPGLTPEALAELKRRVSV